MKQLRKPKLEDICSSARADLITKVSERFALSVRPKLKTKVSERFAPLSELS
jgi:hypothetical protein